MRRDDPFDDLFREMERMMEAMLGDLPRDKPVDASARSEATPSTDAHIDIHETENELRVVADLPNVDKEALTLQCDGRVLRVVATGDHRAYDERIRLPRMVEPTSAAATYNNSILEVSFERAADATQIDLD